VHPLTVPRESPLVYEEDTVSTTGSEDIEDIMDNVHITGSPAARETAHPFPK
jgi:hypothetical protein